MALEVPMPKQLRRIIPFPRQSQPAIGPKAVPSTDVVPNTPANFLRKKIGSPQVMEVATPVRPAEAAEPTAAEKRAELRNAFIDKLTAKADSAEANTWEGILHELHTEGAAQTEQSRGELKRKLNQLEATTEGGQKNRFREARKEAELIDRYASKPYEELNEPDKVQLRAKLLKVIQTSSPVLAQEYDNLTQEKPADAPVMADWLITPTPERPTEFLDTLLSKRGLRTLMQNNLGQTAEGLDSQGAETLFSEKKTKANEVKAGKELVGKNKSQLETAEKALRTYQEANTNRIAELESESVIWDLPSMHRREESLVERIGKSAKNGLQDRELESQLASLRRDIDNIEFKRQELDGKKSAVAKLQQRRDELAGAQEQDAAAGAAEELKEIGTSLSELQDEAIDSVHLVFEQSVNAWLKESKVAVVNAQSAVETQRTGENAEAQKKYFEDLVNRIYISRKTQKIITDSRGRRKIVTEIAYDKKAMAADYNVLMSDFVNVDPAQEMFNRINKRLGRSDLANQIQTLDAQGRSDFIRATLKANYSHGNKGEVLQDLKEISQGHKDSPNEAYKNKPWLKSFHEVLLQDPEIAKTCREMGVDVSPAGISKAIAEEKQNSSRQTLVQVMFGIGVVATAVGSRAAGQEDQQQTV